MAKRKNIGIFGRVNVGKSTLINLISQQNFSIVDKTFGTTCDIKSLFMELHNFGMVKIYDTPGINEKTELGRKKKIRSFFAIKECDFIILVIAPHLIEKSLIYEEEILAFSKKKEKPVFVIYNIFSFSKNKSSSLKKELNLSKYVDLNKKNLEVNKKVLNLSKEEKDLDLKIEAIEEKLNHKSKYLKEDLSKKESFKNVLNFILKNFKKEDKKVDFFSFLKKEDIVFLNIPIDEESPSGRLLKPQAFVQENLLRRYISSFCYRMDLKKARSKDVKERKEEYFRFIENLKFFKKRLKLLITDSQAIDLVHEWTLDNKRRSIVEITTFSIIMANINSQGRISYFLKGIEAFKKLKKGDRILIAEGCNHNRMKEDIGTVQIPSLIYKKFGKDIFIDHAFGREFSSYNLKKYKLVIHCGGCMLDSQKMNARIDDLIEKDIPFTNYGVLLSFLNSKSSLKRVLKPIF